VTDSRVGVYIDAAFGTRDGSLVVDPVDDAFLVFARAVADWLGGLAVFGRLAATEDGDGFVPFQGADVIALPHYAELRRPLAVAGAVGGTAAAFWRALGRVETVWVFGPHPFALLLVVLAGIRRRRVVLGVRQDLVRYVRHRVSGRGAAPALAVAWALEGAFRLLARRLPTTVVGDELAMRYGGDGRAVLPFAVSIVRAAEVAAEPPQHDWSDEIRLLTVGRIEPEKNPLLLLDVLARLDHEHPGRFRLIWVGRGRLEPAARRRANDLGVAGRIDFLGHVPFGREFIHLYRDAHAFVHVSLTEGLPQVLLEARAAGIPVVATDVGGVGAALEHGAAGLLVPPGNADALAAAVVRLTEDAGLRRRLAVRGLELARATTLEAESERVARFIAAASRR
jgi:glycosyltransferase involved in cell wall biosynthesis